MNFFNRPTDIFTINRWWRPIATTLARSIGLPGLTGTKVGMTTALSGPTAAAASTPFSGQSVKRFDPIFQ